MNDRLTVDTINSDQLDALQDQATVLGALRIVLTRCSNAGHPLAPEYLLKFIEDANAVASGPAATEATEPTGQRERPTHPDGTPYRYHEITAEGWEHCDGCHLWGQWTVERPHQCTQDRVQAAAQTKEQ